MKICMKNNPSPYGDFPWKGKKLNAFTLVELIVVITILAILWTIAFISLQWYSRDARDSTRVADINSIEKQLELFVIRTWILPIPENNVELQSSWTTIWYQWYADKSTLNILKVFNWWLDPVDQTAYTYRINAAKKEYQIMWFLENWNVASIFPQANAASNLTNRFPLTKWNILGILLEQTTNNPVQYSWTWILDLSWSTTVYNTYLTNTKTLKYNWNQLRFSLLTLWDFKYKAPEKCPTWFIWAPWNAQFNQKWFCVAKYEMSYADITTNTWTSTWWWIDWNTIAYTWTKIPVSMSWRLPIADIRQGEAISSCQSMWVWYHLITNNEWMSIARNIEQQPVNWSSWQVWSWYIYNWVSNNPTLWCWWATPNNTKWLYPSLWRAWATKTWPWFWNTLCDNKRKLTLSNGSIIWDLAWNVWEYVNKANTLDWVWYATWTNPVLWISNNLWWSWTIVSSSNRALYWPLSSVFNSINWIWKVYRSTWTEFIRWASAFNDFYAGIFSLDLSWTAGIANMYVGFRCAR